MNYFDLTRKNVAEPHKFEGITVERGQRIASYGTLAQETGLSVQSVRTSIKRLKSTHEITSRPTSNYTVFTVVNYDLYQSVQQANQQALNKPPTSFQQAPNNNERKKKKDKKEKEVYSAVAEVLNSVKSLSASAKKVNGG
jgi:hypothetical protein